jgi:hypothetical protein
LVVLLASVPHVAAAPDGGGEILAPEAGAVVRAGEVVRVTWAPVPPDVEEFELLLSLDGGKTFQLRLTAMLDPRLTSYSWRVPNLPTGAARLRLRVGVDGREKMLQPGPPFRLFGDASVPIGRITFQDGEWWPTEGVAVEPHDVEIGPGWSDEEPRVDGAVTAAFPPQRQNVSAPQAVTSAGDNNLLSRRSCPQVPARDDRAATSFPKRE